MKDLIEKLIPIIVDVAKKILPNKYNFSNKRQKYECADIIEDILYVLKTGISWRDIRSKIKWQTLYSHFNILVKNKIFEIAYEELLEKYLRIGKLEKLKYQSIDSSFIPNVYGVDCVGRNKYYKNKKGTKLSVIVDINSIPITLSCDNGNINDAKLVDCLIDNPIIDPEADKYKNNNRYKQYILGDKGYDSRENREKFEEKGYTCIIDCNNRGTKNPKKMRKLTDFEKEKYKKRIKVENLFCYIKKDKRIKNRYEKNVKSFIAFIFLSLSKIILSKMVE